MNKPLSFQQIIITLENYWANQGCIIRQPYHETVGAGTGNPATALRVLGPEPWNVAYVEPVFRPDDGRFGENPNRMQMFFQYQVILKPDPTNPQDLYLNSLYALGLKPEEHDIRFVEDNWESPSLGAWGLGWEVWLDGMEISQYTYFQQAGGLNLDPPCVEFTYGLERIALFLQDVDSVWKIDWDGQRTYSEILHRQEVEYCQYAFNHADVEGLGKAYQFYEEEANRCLAHGLVIPAHDYILKCSHTFNLLDTRGAIGVTERANYFGRMRRQSHKLAKAFVKQREEMGFPLLKESEVIKSRSVKAKENDQTRKVFENLSCLDHRSVDASSFVFEIGSEELPHRDLLITIEQLQKAVPDMFEQLRLTHDNIYVSGTPRRQVVIVDNVAPHQTDLTQELKGPSAKIAYDNEGNPTKAAKGFARGHGVDVADLIRREYKGIEYMYAIKKVEGKTAHEVLAESLPDLIKGITFGKSMRWLSLAQVGKEVAKITYSRPIRWLVALLGDEIIPFEYAAVTSGNMSYGSRGKGSPQIKIPHADSYRQLMTDNHVVLDYRERSQKILGQLQALTSEVNGKPLLDADLLAEVTNLVEQPTAILGSYDKSYLALPAPILITVMKKHQRYFPVIDDAGNLLPYFVAVRNGNDRHVDSVRKGNEHVLQARYADAEFFFNADTGKKLEDFLPRLKTLTFQEKLGSMHDKAKRLEVLAPKIGVRIQDSEVRIKATQRAALLCKADLATEMVVEMTSLQGIMGYEYALLSGEHESVAIAIKEHYLPNFSGDKLPESDIGIVLSIANRLDSLTGLFAVGLAPSGSADPFALRREALGLVTILMEKKLNFSIEFGLKESAALQPITISSKGLAETSTFIQRRLEILLLDKGFEHDVVKAILAERGDNPYLALEACHDLTKFVKQNDWETVLTTFARCVRIVRKIKENYMVNPELFTEPAEKNLYHAYQQVTANLNSDSRLSHVIQAISEILVNPINVFFDAILVMSDDQATRENRLALMQQIWNLTKGYADFSCLKGF